MRELQYETHIHFKNGLEGLINFSISDEYSESELHSMVHDLIIKEFGEYEKYSINLRY